MNKAHIAAAVVAVAVALVVIYIMGVALMEAPSQEELRQVENNTTAPDTGPPGYTGAPIMTAQIAGVLAILTGGVLYHLKTGQRHSLPDPTCTQCNAVGYPTTHKGDKTIQCEECDKILYRQT